jgi:hypothetical protein
MHTVRGFGMPGTPLRRLPWNGPEGRPAYLPDDGSGGFLARLADAAEETQLATGGQVLLLARRMLQEEAERLTVDELSYVTRRLSECLADALRVAESRGDRLNRVTPLPAVDSPSA